AGNIEAWNWSESQFGQLSDQALLRVGRPSISRVLPVRLPQGDILVVGHDMPDQQKIRFLVVRSLAIGGVLAAALAVLGALLVHRRIEVRLAAIRGIAAKIESGQLDWRIPPASGHDEFSRLNGDINRMLDRIQQLMDGVRHVSNAIAHDLRTPLGRLRARLDETLRAGDAAALPQAAEDTIAGIDQLTLLFERLLQIAEAESGTRRQSFAPVPLAALASTIAELYDALAEEKGMSLTLDAPEEAEILGDRELLSALLANLVENAFKYAVHPGGHVGLALTIGAETVDLSVRDDGPGIPAEERGRVLERFYRIDRSRSVPGNGLGLPLAAAIVALHGGVLTLEDGHPGLKVRVSLPRNLSKP
ncbi:MAG TPA: HAMP domain-containing sensor histidine kinase, partial [Magnetospirillaceae bacterium]|nr:HAMP domain-containing sensor histidine kinase [Magnetospirillaceae bacterium]